MILHRFVQIHTLQDGRIEARQQFRGHNDELQGRQRITELIEQFLLLIVGQLILCIFIRLVVGGMHHDGRLVATLCQHGIQFFLIGHAAGTVIDHHLTLQSCRLHILTIVLHDVVTHLMDALGRSEESLYFGTLCQLVLLFIGKSIFLGHLVKGLLKICLIQMKFHRHLTEVQLQRGTIVDRILERVFRHIAAFVLICTEALESVLIALIDGRTRQSEEKGVGQCQTHTLSKIPLLRAVSLVHKYDDVFPDIQGLLHLAKEEDGRDQYLALVLCEEICQVAAIIDKVHILNLRTGKVAGDLVSQVYTVIHDYHRWSIQRLHLHQLLGSKHHQP